MKKSFKYLNYLVIIFCIQFIACRNNNKSNNGANTNQQVTNKGNCSGAKQYALKTYINVNGGGLNYTIEGCNENPDGSFQITLQKTGTYDSNGNLEKRYVRVGFDGNNYY
jgi:hypothetical protein